MIYTYKGHNLGCRNLWNSPVMCLRPVMFLLLLSSQSLSSIFVSSGGLFPHTIITAHSICRNVWLLLSCALLPYYIPTPRYRASMFTLNWISTDDLSVSSLHLVLCLSVGSTSIVPLSPYSHLTQPSLTTCSYPQAVVPLANVTYQISNMCKKMIAPSAHAKSVSKTSVCRSRSQCPCNSLCIATPQSTGNYSIAFVFSFYFRKWTAHLWLGHLATIMMVIPTS